LNLVDITRAIPIDKSKNNLTKSNLTLSNLTSNNLAYVIYTSGSTGTPKGVLINHGNVVRLFKTEKPLFDFSENDVWTMFHSFCFDFSVWEMYGALLFGGKLVIVPSEVTKDVKLFTNLLITEKVTILNQTPSAFYVLQENMVETTKTTGIRNVIFGGEALTLSKLSPWSQSYPHSKLINMYGITETTVHVTYKEITSDDIQTGQSIIGKPIPTLNIYILDKQQNIVPIGVPGEIHVAGAGVSRGYLNREELTKSRFIPNPFGKNQDERIYRTGDIGRWLPDGNIEYLGRIDDQVKIRGYRIELGEIESVIEQSGLISQAVVIAKQNTEGNKLLIGYVVANQKGTFNKQAIQEYLKGKLPEYMVPQLWVELEQLPLTSNGKIDKKALPDPDLTEMFEKQYVAPSNQTETMLAEIWQELLGVEKVGIYDNFFELGGDSILTIQLSSRAGRKGLSLQPKDIFMHQTIAGLSKAILDKIQTQSHAEQGVLSGEAGLIPIQQWYLQSTTEDVSHYNQSVFLELDKVVSKDEVSICLDALAEHHDGLRMQFNKTSYGWIQQYTNNKLKLKEEDLSKLTQVEFKETVSKLATDYQKSLDIEKGDILRFVWIKTPADQKNNRLLIIIHHLVVDGVSWRILLEDMEIILHALKENKTPQLGQKTSSFREWYKALESYSSQPQVKDKLNYWAKAVKAYEPIATEFAYNGDSKIKDAISHSVSIGKSATKRLVQDVSKVYNTQINDLLLCSLAMTISEWAKTNKVSIGLEGHGRESVTENIDTTRTVGWFTNMYPVNLKLESQAPIGNQIKSIKEQLRRIPDKGMGYGVLKYINKEDSLQGEDPWDIVFNYLGQLDNITSESRWFKVAEESSGLSRSLEQKSREKLTINSSILQGNLSLNWTCSGLNYSAETLKLLATSFISNLNKLIDYCLEQKQSGTFFTPSDYGLNDEITYSELDSFLEETFKGETRRNQIQSIYRLSGLQQGMLFHSLYDTGSTAYLEKFSFDLRDIVPEYIQKSWDYVIKNHSILRSAFYHEEFSIPVQVVYNHVELPIAWIDFRDLSKKDQLAAIKEYEEQEVAKGFDMKAAPLMRLAVIQLGKNDYKMVWTFHHILADGWSMPILMEEFLRTYDGLVKAEKLPVKEEDRFEDYIRYIENTDSNKAKSYWTEYLSGLETITQLPFIESTSERNKGIGKYEFEYLLLNENKTKKIQNYAQVQKVTINTLMQGIWSYLLSCYTGNSEVTFGVTVSGRPDDLPAVEQKVGLFINTLPLYAKLDDSLSIGSWLEALQQDQILSRNYQYSALQEIQSWSGIKGDLFDTLLVFENYPVSKVINSNPWSLDVQKVNVKQNTNYPFAITIGSAEQTSIRLSYNSSLLDLENVKMIGNHFEYVLDQIINNPKAYWKDIKLLSTAEENQILNNFSHSKVVYPKDKTIVELFENQVEKTPDAIAVVFEGDEISFKELNKRSNQLANCLKEKGVQRETLVPLFVGRSLEMLIGILGILKSGGAYVPIDTEYPADRINFILEDTGAKIIVSGSEGKSKVKANGIEIIDIKSDWDLIEKQSDTNGISLPQPHDLMYVIYTSGSTGKPKGVMIEHQSLLDHCFGLIKSAELKSCSSFALFSPLVFDAGHAIIFTSLLQGAALHVLSKELLSSGEKVHSYLETNSIDCIKIVPSLWQVYADDNHILSPNKVIIFGGETLSGKILDQLKNYEYNGLVFNHYGPTEASIGKTIHKIDLKNHYKSVPIGKPFSNTSLYILNASKNMVPVGLGGELYIAGDGLARGYLNLQDLTSENFVQNPFEDKFNAKMYKTGDFVKWLPDGNIEYLGRIDNQIKVNGYRIEPVEIQSVIEEFDLVSQALVLAKPMSDSTNQLVAYYVSDEEIDKQALQEFVKSRLPNYMVPLIWVKLESMPLTSNGKIDRKALPDPNLSDELAKQYIAPRNETEATLTEIWKHLLKIEQIGVNDNFFEIGGHSLLAMRMISAIKKQTDVEINIKDIFNLTTIERLSEFILEQSKEDVLIF
jgi:amino acid adenylation domain-containing protein/non-ribosomal peptide synthase protein (TIGR01720 family)